MPIKTSLKKTHPNVSFDKYLPFCSGHNRKTDGAPDANFAVTGGTEGCQHCHADVSMTMLTTFSSRSVSKLGIMTDFGI